MPTYVAFLRAVNIGKRPYPMAELRAALEAAGYEAPQTHIQTGNVLVTSRARSRAKVEAALEEVFEADRGFAVPTIVLTPAELTQVAQDADDLAAAHAAEHGAEHGHYVSLLKESPTPEGTAALEGHGFPDETVVVKDRAVHLLYAKPYHEAKMSNVQIERALGVATNRNAKVIRALAAKWGA